MILSLLGYREGTRINIFFARQQVPCHLWQIEPLPTRYKVSKYFDQDLRTPTTTKM